MYVTDLAFDTVDAGARLRLRRVPRRQLPEGRRVCERRWRRDWSNLLLPALGAVRLALSDSGHILYAATSTRRLHARRRRRPTAPARRTTQTLCLDAARFRVAATWTKPDASSGQGHAVPLTGDTGYFWFFDSSNVEVMVKVLEACGVNGHRWVFASGLTNVHVNLTVTDVVTGTTNTYRNPQGTAFLPSPGHQGVFVPVKAWSGEAPSTRSAIPTARGERR